MHEIKNDCDLIPDVARSPQFDFVSTSTTLVYLLRLSKIGILYLQIKCRINTMLVAVTRN